MLILPTGSGAIHVSYRLTVWDDRPRIAITYQARGIGKDAMMLPSKKRLFVYLCCVSCVCYAFSGSIFRNVAANFGRLDDIEDLANFPDSAIRRQSRLDVVTERAEQIGNWTLTDIRPPDVMSEAGHAVDGAGYSATLRALPQKAGASSRSDGHLDVGQLPQFNIGPYVIVPCSAFWDDRPELDPHPVVRILTVVITEQDGVINAMGLKQNMSCALWCDGNVVVSDVHDHISYSAPWRPADYHYSRGIITCTLPKGCNNAIPDQVALIHRGRPIEGGSGLPVQAPSSKKKASFQLIICTGVWFGGLDPYELVEWFEMQRLLGVDKVVVYKDRLESDAWEVVRMYRDQGFADVWHVNDSNSQSEYSYVWQVPSLTHCMLKYMYAAERIMFIDADEIIIPMETDTLPELIDRLDQTQGDAKPGVQYMFYAMNFLVNASHREPAPAASPGSIYLRYRQRLASHSAHVKSILNPRSCLVFGPHRCKLPVYPAAHRVAVDVSSGRLHHYRKEIKSRTFNDIGGVGDVVRDDVIMTRYAKRLIRGVTRQLNVLRVQ